MASTCAGTLFRHADRPDHENFLARQIVVPLQGTSPEPPKDSGWKRYEQFAIRRDQDIFCN